MVTKYAGGVVKGFALIAGIIVTGCVQWVLTGQPLTAKDFSAIAMVSYAIYLHSSYPYKAGKLYKTISTTMFMEDDAFLSPRSKKGRSGLSHPNSPKRSHDWSIGSSGASTPPTPAGDRESINPEQQTPFATKLAKVNTNTLPRNHSSSSNLQLHSTTGSTSSGLSPAQSMHAAMRRNSSSDVTLDYLSLANAGVNTAKVLQVQ